MLQAMNTGHDGSLCTLHANTPEDALLRLTNMLQMGAERLSEQIIQAQIASAVDLVVQLERMRDGQRRITAISEITALEGGQIRMQRCFVSCWSPSCMASCRGASWPIRSRAGVQEKARQAGLLAELQRAWMKMGRRAHEYAVIRLPWLGGGLSAALAVAESA